MGQESCPIFSYDVENQAARKVKAQRNFSVGNKFIHRLLLRGQPPQKGDAMKNIDLEVIIRGTPKDALAINFLVKEIIVFKDKIEIVFNNPLNGPDENRDHCFYEQLRYISVTAFAQYQTDKRAILVKMSV